MTHSPIHILRIPLLALLAILLGMGVLAIDSSRRERAAAAPAPAAVAGAQAVAGAPGTLVAASEPVAAAAAAPVAPAAAPVPAAPVVVAKRGGIACAAPHQLVQVPRDVAVRARPNGMRIGAVPRSSHYLGSPMTAWVQAVTPDGKWGKVTIPWGRNVKRAGWISMVGLPHAATRTMVVSDLSERRVRVYRGCREVVNVPAAVGAVGSPSPTGRFFVTDRVPVPAGQSQFGSFAFGLSTIQPNTPAGWTGGNQMAIHGTNQPSSIGTRASAGCLRVSEAALAKLRPMLAVGTPVVIQA